MLSKNIISHITQLRLKKNREQYFEFIAEGSKLVCDLLDSEYVFKSIYATSDWVDSIGKKYHGKFTEITIVSAKEMERISQLKTPSDILAVVEIPQKSFSFEKVRNELSIVLDTIQDPGNLGTIIRTADWFGIKNIICSEDTVDVYNSKVVQATMGSVSRVNVYYVNLHELLERCEIEKNFPVYGTFLNGKNIFQEPLSKNGFIIMGNEGNGISERLSSFITDRLYIPSFQVSGVTSESLNVSIATAIVCAEFRRRN